MRHTCRLLAISLGLSVLGVGLQGVQPHPPAIAQSARSSSIPMNAVTIRSDTQEANSKTGVITARGNVHVYYPSRQMQATSAQAQYFSRERRIVMTGNVYVLQAGNSLRGEVVTYLMDEGRFVATPRTTKQVESIYLVEDGSSTPAPAPKPVVSPPPLRPLALPGLTPATSAAPTVPATPTPSNTVVPAPVAPPSPDPVVVPTPNFANP